MVEQSVQPPQQNIMEDVCCKAPVWLESLLNAEYFLPCKLHAAAHRNERNYFCVDCCSDGICSLCLAKHSSHRTLQIRKSSYHDCVRIADLKGWLDLSFIQVYVINSAKIVFLNGRPQPKPAKGAIYTCESCHRTLLDAVRFCSIGCKLKAMKHDPPDDTLSLEQQRGSGGLGTPGRGSSWGTEDSQGSQDEPKRLPNWRKRPPPPLEEVEESQDCSERLCSDGDDNSVGEEEVRMGGSGNEQKFFVNKKRRNILHKLLEPASPSSVLPTLPTTPSSCDALENSLRVKSRKGTPQRAPLW